MKIWRLIPALTLAFSGVLMSAGVASANPAPSNNWPPGSTYNCNGSDGGIIPPGNYGSIIVTGVCYMPAGTINVRGNLTVAPGALLDNVTPGDGFALPTSTPGLEPGGTPLVTATVLVGGNVSVGAGAVLFLGCSPNISCPEAVTYNRIGGNLTATDALGVVVHSTSVGGNFSLLGGGGGPSIVDGVGSGACLGNPPFSGIDVPAAGPWNDDPSLVGTPVYSDAEDNTIGGNLSIIGLQSCWLGSLRNQVGGSITIAGNSMGDPDATEVGNNLVGGNMTCLGNDPQAQYGDSGAAPNIVGGLGIGECGFNVQVLNPAPEAMEGPGTLEHISVSASSLGTYFGAHIQTAQPLSVELATTSSGQTLVGEVNNDILSGSGLNGSITFDPSQAIGDSGETFLGTVQPDGSTSFEVNDICSPCNFDGQTGATAIRAYGTKSVNGFISGTFLIDSGGTGLGGLSTLAGWGTFSGFGLTLHLVEHLKIT